MSFFALRRIATFAAFGLLVVQAPVSHAGPYAQQLGKCMNDSFSDQDRSNFIQWIFAMMAGHPTVAPLAKVSDADLDGISKRIGETISRVITGPCAENARDMFSYEGPAALGEAFSLVGQFSAMSLMTDKSVVSRAAGVAKYMDAEALAALVGSRGNGAASPATPPASKGAKDAEAPRKSP